MLNPQKEAHRKVRRLDQERRLLRRAVDMTEGDLPIHEMHRRLSEIHEAKRDARRFAGRRWS